MKAIDSVKNNLLPRLQELLTHLADTDQIAAQNFFTKIFTDLNQTETEEQLLELFIELSTTAFLGIPFDDISLAIIDEILQEAEQISAAFSADGTTIQ